MSAWKISEHRWMKNRKKLAIVLLIVLALSIFGGVTAAYVWHNVSSDNQMTAKRYYFTIDHLGDTNEDEQLTRTIDLYGGNTKNFAFRVQNYFDSERVSEETANYTVGIRTTAVKNVNSTYTNGVKITSGGADVSASTSHTLGMTNTSHKDFNVVIPAGYKDGDVVVVDVKSTRPYIKNMSLVLKLHTSPAQVSYYVEDNVGSPYAKLYVLSTVDIPAGKLAVNWSGYNSTGNNLQLDMTNSYFITDLGAGLTHDQTDLGMNNGSYLQKAVTSQSISAGGSIAVMFFKADPSQDYSLAATDKPVAAILKDDVYTVNISKEN